ncbi:hypothetical protein C0Q70_02525 [Pomacea canaliculata]|uniref:Lysine-specific metallo-endopeptidase domain-containing protein n=1 Tax=Pomacea canaliculata TaxID=400727 RepID=A0A2T7PQ64_POMCA|nr:uncharacterized protein LOC112558272 [Pomacea canaliculata]PVD35562.1 hypothetical protein C0Q70_02525 [Pomacea canaliculata]
MARMSIGLLLVLSITEFVLARPPAGTITLSTAPLSFEDRVRLQSLASPRSNLPANFKLLYVAQDGRTVEGQKPSTGYWIEVSGSPGASKAAVYQAAREISSMLRHAPAHIFNNLANHPNTGVGVFSSAEKIVVYPEYQYLADYPACYGRCDGSCSQTCTFDGRKYETLAGVGGDRALVSEENVMCTATDPYYHRDNIVVHEFAHTLERIGLNANEKAQVIQAYNNARSRSLWVLSSYAMTSHEEYFAEATGSFFRVNLQDSSGGMTACSGGECRTEEEVRRLMSSHDPQLYNILSNVYYSGNPVSPSGVTICPRQ